jgi:hypothetical protein
MIQVVLAVGLSAQPTAWPANNKPPSNLNGNYVYVDQGTSTIVIVVPGSLRGRPDQPEQTLRIPYRNRFDPHVTSSVSRVEIGRFLYGYSLSNGREAVDSVNSWKIATTCGGAFEIVAQPGGWHCMRLEHAIAVRQYALSYVAGPVCPVQCFLDRKQAPGSPSDKLSVVSALKPGLTSVTAEDYTAFPVAQLSEDLPDAVVTQVARLSNFARSAKDAITVGPRFGPEVSFQEIANDFLDGLGLLAQGGRLRGDSSFAKQLRAELERAATGGRFDGARLASPSTELEREITVAVRLSLSPDAP